MQEVSQTGLKFAYGMGYEYFWIMDDDVIPEPDCLQTLIQGGNTVEDWGFLCSQVIGTNGEQMNVPAISKKSGDNGYPQWAKHLNQGIIELASGTFVSVLFPRNIVSQVGLPIAEMFIWGDDVEYTRRITEKRHGYLIGGSVALHLRSSQKSLSFPEETNTARIRMYYYYIRNNIYISGRYEGRRQNGIMHLK